MSISRVPYFDLGVLCKNGAKTSLRPLGGSTWPDLASANLRLANGHVKSTSMLRVDVSGTLSEELERLAAERKARAIG